MLPNNPKVSVCITTYNHEKYIAQALDGALMQLTDFEYDILVGEDDSSDETREIVKAYAKKNPDKIRLFLNSRENVIYINGRPTGAWNFVNNLMHARGKYIALCDGDDYWTDPLKLQRQVRFLEENLDCSLVFHGMTKIYEDGNSDTYSYPFNTAITTIEDLLVRNYISTNSVMFHRGLFVDFPSWYYQVQPGDWPLYLLNAQFGKIGYIDENMSVYRIHSGGFFSTLSKVTKIHSRIETYEHFDRHSNFKYHDLIRSLILQRFGQLSLAYLQSDEFDKAQYFARKCNIWCISHHKRFHLLVLKYIPHLYKPLRSIRRAIIRQH